MQRFIQSVFLAAICLCVAGSTIGCSFIGYAVGGAIDGPRYALDSLTVRKGGDSAELEYRLGDMDRLSSLAKEASPGSGSMVEVLTQTGVLVGDALTLDTVLAVMGDPADNGSEWLLPGEWVNVNIRGLDLKTVNGRVVRLNERYIVLQVDGENRPFGFNIVNAITRRGGRTLISSELASPGFFGRLVRVPGLLLGRDSYPIFVPFRKVELIRVAHPVARWGGARIIFVALGALFVDIPLIYFAIQPRGYL